VYQPAVGCLGPLGKNRRNFTARRRLDALVQVARAPPRPLRQQSPRGGLAAPLEAPQNQGRRNRQQRHAACLAKAVRITGCGRAERETPPLGAAAGKDSVWRTPAHAVRSAAIVPELHYLPLPPGWEPKGGLGISGNLLPKRNAWSMLCEWQHSPMTSFSPDRRRGGLLLMRLVSLRRWRRRIEDWIVEPTISIWLKSNSTTAAPAPA